MLEIHQITDRLLPLRDDEPPSLRQDIADEILDHLQVALRRDLLVHGSDEVTARQRVLRNFGDPRQVARQLWFQAMWSKIMMQRLVVGGALFSMAVSAALVGMVALMMREQQRGNVELLEHVARLIPSKMEAQPPLQPERRLDSLKIKVTMGAKDGPAAKGFSVTVLKVPKIGDVVAQEGFTQESTSGQNHSKEETIRKELEAKTDAEGLVDCGYVEPGLYEFRVTTPWNEAVSAKLTVQPGKDHLEHVIAPEKLPDLTDVILSLDRLPDDLDAKHFGLVLSFHPIGSRDFAGRSWSRGGDWYFGKSAPFLLVVPRHGVWISQVDWTSGDTRHPDAIYRPNRGPSAKWERLEPPYRFQIPAHEYSVLFDFLRVPVNDGPADVNWPKNVLFDWQQSMLEWGAGGRSNSDPNVIQLAAKPRESNNWMIAIPEPVLKGWSQRRAMQSIQNQYPQGSDPFARPMGAWFPFRIDEPSLIREMRFLPNSQFDFTDQQQQTLMEILGTCREFFVNHPPGGAPPTGDVELWRAKFVEFETMVVDVLTPVQKAIWERRKLNIKGQDRPLGFETFELNRELMNEGFAQRIDLTNEQTNEIRMISNRRNSGRGGRGRGAIVAGQSDEVDDMMLSVLTLDQRAIWEQRQAELKQELATLEKYQAAKDAAEEANPQSAVAPRPSVQRGGRNVGRPRTELPNAAQPASDPDRMADLQQQIESLKLQIEKLKATSTAPKTND